MSKVEGISTSEPFPPNKKRQRSRHSDVARLRLLVIVAVLTIVVAACTGPTDGSTVSVASAPTPSASTSAKDVQVIVLVHGFADNRQGYSCADYWRAAEKAFSRWDPGVQVVTVGFVSGDHDCDMTIGSDGPITPIGDIGAQLATAVYQKFSARGIPVALVGHSMGGLVVRSALAQAGSQSGPPFLLVPHAVTIESPHGGTDVLKRMGCPLTECDEMGIGSAFLRHLEPDPQGQGGTVWTLFGSAGDHLVTIASALGMPATHRVAYERPLYGHNPIVHDGSNAADARWRVITGHSRFLHNHEPHSLRAIFLAATTGSPDG